MHQHVTIGDMILRVGDRLKVNGRGEDNGLGRNGEIIKVISIKNDGGILIGLYSDRRHNGWGDLDGAVPSRQGFWATRDCVMDNFSILANEYEICADHMHHKRNLKGLSCKILHTFGDGFSFVELEENVGGGSADGLGKAGHCVVVHKNVVAKKKKKKKAAPKRKSSGKKKPVAKKKEKVMSLEDLMNGGFPQFEPLNAEPSVPETDTLWVVPPDSDPPEES